MCGIAGIFNFDPDRPVDTALLERFAAAIAHRGPDEDGFFVRGEVGLANRRLSIIGLADGRQPIANEDGTVWTVFNGEIYNFPDLRAELEAKGHRFRTSTDTEVLVHLYEEDGTDFVLRLNGMFGIALWDVSRRRLLLYRDRLGEKPLYFTVESDRLLFASEIKALLRAPTVAREVDAGALVDYLTFQYTPGPQTIFRGIRRLRPGTLLEVSARGVTERTYWEVPVAAAPARDEAEWVEAVADLLRDAVRRRLLSEVPLGAFLSGGVDSSTVVGLMAGLTDRPVQTFSVGFAVPGAYDESAHAARVARHFGAEHRALVVDSVDVERLLTKTVMHLDEPVADYAAIPTYLVSEFARRHVKVVLTGEGADELFAGYDHYRFTDLLGRYARLPAFARRLGAGIGAAVAPARIAKALAAATLSPVDAYVLLKSVFRPDDLDALLAPEMRAAAREGGDRSGLRAHFARSEGRALLDRYLIADTATWLPEDLLMKVDKMSMAVSLEARVPFLDHRLVELVASAPADLKWRGGPKYLLKRVAERLVPRDVLERPKHGFTLPLDRWFRTDLRGFATDLLLGERARRRAFFRPEAVERLWSRYLAAGAGGLMPVWTLVNLEVWCRVFLDGETAYGSPTT
ncbi:MAG: asparagine synthase (glutamine-hydrolyzing) [Candidatus Binatia bacterium]